MLHNMDYNKDSRRILEKGYNPREMEETGDVGDGSLQ